MMRTIFFSIAFLSLALAGVQASDSPIPERDDLPNTVQVTWTYAGPNPGGQIGLGNFEILESSRSVVDSKQIVDLRKGSRARQLMLLRDIARGEGTVRHSEIEKSIKILERMVAEEKARRRHLPKPPREMTREERIADLIYQLRDFSDVDEDYKGGGLLVDFFGKSRSPAQILLNYGSAAAPQLIAAMGDDTFTRCYLQKRVGDCAGFVLNEISFLPLAEPAFVAEGNAESAREKATAWWKEFQAKGEERMLIEGLETADRFSSFADRLVQNYPERALAAIRKRFANHRSTELLNSAAKLPGKDAEDFLIEALHDSDFRVSMSAANLLKERRSAVAVNFIIGKWRETVAVPPRPGRYHGSRKQLLVHFLIYSGNTDALGALSGPMLDQPIEAREDTIEHVAKVLLNKATRREVQQAAVQFLRERLEDTAEPSWNDTRVFDRGVFARPCDRAAIALAAFRGCPNTIDVEAPLRQRERQRLELLNEWRRERGLAALPLPAESRVIAVADRVVEPFLARFIEEKTSVGQDELGTRIEALGLGALPAIQRRLKTFSAEDPAPEELVALASRVSFTIAELRFVEEGGARIPEEVRTALERYKGHALPMTPESIDEFTDAAWRDLPEPVQSRLFIERPTTGTGAIVTLTWSEIAGGNAPHSARRGRHEKSIAGWVACQGKNVQDPYSLGCLGLPSPIDVHELRNLGRVLRSLPADKETLVRIEFAHH